MLVRLTDITVPDLVNIKPERRSQLGSILTCVWSGRRSSRMWKSFTGLRKVLHFWRHWRRCTSEKSTPHSTPGMNTEAGNWRFCFDRFSCSPFSFLLVYTNLKYFSILVVFTEDVRKNEMISFEKMDSTLSSLHLPITYLTRLCTVASYGIFLVMRSKDLRRRGTSRSA